jgi:hypothetical protein
MLSQMEKTVLKIIDTNSATKTNDQVQKYLFHGGTRLHHCFCPHSGQKCAEASIRVLHLGQIFKTIG